MNQLIERLLKFRKDRQWEYYHTPKELARALMIEAAELNREFLWKNNFKVLSVKEELADIFIYLLYLAHEMDCDLISEANKKIDKNAKKYPINDSINKW
jgi:NTP pyrophosphatase (non-canonical NTP hydrolase)